MKKTLAGIIVSFSIQAWTFAQAQDSCSEYAEINDLREKNPYSFLYRDCDCGQGLEEKYKVTAPEQMSLISVCGYRPENYVGFFYFKGDALVEGLIKRNDYVSGTELQFVAPRKQRAEISDTLDLRDELRILDFSGSSEFHAPELTAGIECRKAMAKVRIMDLAVIMSDSDEQGAFPMKFKILSLGSYEEGPGEN